MIHVRRPRPGPAALRSETARKEQRDAEGFYGDEANEKLEFKFTAYQDRSVREVLEKMFRSKCAYCEIRIGAGDESEIEHWRPKGAVKEDDGRRLRGYYWLASDWDNLLLSCLKCNRPRKYRVGDTEEDEETWERTGKGMLFPIAEGDVRALLKGQERSEHPLLLNPSRDKPDKYLDFIVFDNDPDREATVQPKGHRGRRRALGEQSIRVYSLNRDPLVYERREALKDLQWHLAEISLSADKLDALPDSSTERKEHYERIARNLAEIARRLSPNSEFLLMAQQTIRAYLEREPGLRARLAPLVRR